MIAPNPLWRCYLLAKKSSSGVTRDEDYTEMYYDISGSNLDDEDGNDEDQDCSDAGNFADDIVAANAVFHFDTATASSSLFGRRILPTKSFFINISGDAASRVFCPGKKFLFSVRAMSHGKYWKLVTSVEVREIGTGKRSKLIQFIPCALLFITKDIEVWIAV